MGRDAFIAMVYHDVMMSIVFNAENSLIKHAHTLSVLKKTARHAIRDMPPDLQIQLHLVIRSSIDAMTELGPFEYQCDCPTGGAKQSIYVPLVLRYTSPEPRSHLEARARRLGKSCEDDAFGVDVPLATCVHVQI